MIGKKPETPLEQWEAVAAFARGAAPASVDDRTDAEIAAELRARGVDPERIGENTRAFVEQMLAEEEAEEARAEVPVASPSGPAHDPVVTAAPDSRPVVVEAQAAVPEEPARVIPIGRRGPRARWTVVLLAAAVVLALGAGAAVGIAVRDRSPRTPLGPDPLVPRRREDPMIALQLAARLRDEARDECTRQEWATCQAKLDDARALDPAGDRDPDVQAYRARAAAGLKEEERRAPAPDKGPKGPDKGPRAP